MTPPMTPSVTALSEIGKPQTHTRTSQDYTSANPDPYTQNPDPYTHQTTPNHSPHNESTKSANLDPPT